MENNINFTSSLKSKLILMAAIPALALLYFAGSGDLERQATSKEIVKLEALVDVSIEIGFSFFANGYQSLTSLILNARYDASHLPSCGVVCAINRTMFSKASDRRWIVATCLIASSYT